MTDQTYDILEQKTRDVQASWNTMISETDIDLNHPAVQAFQEDLNTLIRTVESKTPVKS